MRRRPPELNPRQYRALAKFRYALRAFLSFSESASRSSGVTTQQYQALLVIKASATEAVSIRELADEMLLKHNNTVQLVDRLVEAGLVRREQSRIDRRAVELTLTAKGEKQIAHLAAVHFRALIARLDELTDIFELATKIGKMR